MKVYTAPEHVENDYPIIFLAGGITHCSDWQKEVVKYFRNKDYNYVLCNPRRDNFPIYDLNASHEQIKWEFDCLERCDVFTIYFDYSEKSDQPICFYELGRNLLRMKEKFPDDWDKRIVITCNNDFRRFLDVVIQTELAVKSKVHVNIGDVYTHIYAIEETIKYL